MHEKTVYLECLRYLSNARETIAKANKDNGTYKDIKQVMADQTDLVAILAEFQPRLVKMDAGRAPRGGGEG